jgi:hypothetical protein
LLHPEIQLRKDEASRKIRSPNGAGVHAWRLHDIARSRGVGCVASHRSIQFHRSVYVDIPWSLADGLRSFIRMASGTAHSSRQREFSVHVAKRQRIRLTRTHRGAVIRTDHPRYPPAREAIGERSIGSSCPLVSACPKYPVAAARVGVSFLRALISTIRARVHGWGDLSDRALLASTEKDRCASD